MTSLRYCFLTSKHLNSIKFRSLSQAVSSRSLASSTRLLSDLQHQANVSTNNAKLIYSGKLKKRIIYLKGLSLVSSVVIVGSYGYVCNQNGLTGALAGMGVAFTPFFLSPFIISWFFKRYVIELYYNIQDDTYTIHHFGLFLDIKRITFSRDRVIKSHAADALNTFKVDKKSFFLHEEDLLDVDSVDLYKRMLQLDKSDTSGGKSD